MSPVKSNRLLSYRGDMLKSWKPGTVETMPSQWQRPNKWHLLIKLILYTISPPGWSNKVPEVLGTSHDPLREGAKERQSKCNERRFHREGMSQCLPQMLDIWLWVSPRGRNGLEILGNAKLLMTTTCHNLPLWFRASQTFSSRSTLGSDDRIQGLWLEGKNLQ